VIFAPVALLVLFIALCLVLRALEPSLLFHPRTDKEWFPSPSDFEELVFPDKTSAIWCPLAHAELVVLYCHGNYGNISMRAEWVRALQLHLGASVLLFDYPGFGKTPGKPNESGCYQSAQSAFDWLIQNGWKSEQIVLCGKSLGAAIALEMARRQPTCRALVLIDPFSNVPDAAPKSATSGCPKSSSAPNSTVCVRLGWRKSWARRRANPRACGL